MRWWALGLGAVAGCGGGEARTCTAEECAAIASPAAAPVAGLTPFEGAIVGPLLDDLRLGVRPWSDRAVGICRGARVCEEWVGADGGELPPGEYVVRAELGVPRLGAPGTWQAVWHSECKVTTTSAKGETRTRKVASDRTYELHWAGEGQGFRLEPLQRIRSPGDGAQECVWQLTVGPSAGTGAEPAQTRTFGGVWSVPARPAE